MDMYLVQHGEARAESEDPARPLTERGGSRFKESVKGLEWLAGGGGEGVPGPRPIRGGPRP